VLEGENWALVENNTVFLWNGTHSLNYTIILKSKIEVCNFSIDELFFYNMSRIGKKEWVEDVRGYEGVPVVNETARVWQGSADLLFVEILSTLDNCLVDGELGKIFVIEKRGEHSVTCGADARIVAFNITAPLGNVVKAGKDVLFVGKGNIAYSNGSFFFKAEKAEQEGNRTFTVLGRVNKTVYVDASPPEVEIKGELNLIAYEGCVKGNISAEFRDASLKKRHFEIAGKSDQEFCKVGNYTAFAWAEDEAGFRTEINRTVHVGNATYRMSYVLPVQEFVLNGSDLNVIWLANITFVLDGYAKGDLNYSLEINGKNVNFFFENVRGPWKKAIEYRFDNESVEVDKKQGWSVINGVNATCYFYNLSREINYRAEVEAPQHDPESEHVEGFYSRDGINWIIFASKGIKGSWNVVYEGNATLIKVCILPEREPDYFFCGDGICSAWESCSSCAVDCGTCAPAGGGGRSFSFAAASQNQKPNRTKNREKGVKKKIEGINAGVFRIVENPEAVMFLDNTTLIVNGSCRIFVNESYEVVDEKGNVVGSGEIALKSGKYRIVKLSSEGKNESSNAGVVEMVENACSSDKMEIKPVVRLNMGLITVIMLLAAILLLFRV